MAIRAWTLAAVAVASLYSPIAQADDFKLVMFEEPGCFWCDRWKEEIGPIYPKTAEGRTAPLEVIDIDEALPHEVVLNSNPVYTPTFILLRNGAEVGVIEGYPGEDFFWWMLEEMLKDYPEYQEETAAS